MERQDLERIMAEPDRTQRVLRALKREAIAGALVLSATAIGVGGFFAYAGYEINRQEQAAQMKTEYRRDASAFGKLIIYETLVVGTAYGASKLIKRSWDRQQE